MARYGNTVVNQVQTDPARIQNAIPPVAQQPRALVQGPNRFDSFTGPRGGNSVKWHIDGKDFFYAVSEMLDSARQTIMIMDWWLSPELYLRRPPAYYPEWRLDRVLKRKAEEGVKIHIIIYKEIPALMPLSSHYTKIALESLHENISVMRHPDHIGFKEDVEVWSHHEKAIIIDNHRASIGGLDLSFGRWDTHNHPLADVHPTKFARTLFPGQDYNNARVLDFQNVQNYANNKISILETPRMPWHDVHMTIVGPSVFDIVRHFVARWSLIKERKYKEDPRYQTLTVPQFSSAQAFHQFFSPARFYPPSSQAPQGRMNVQVVRSTSHWSLGVPTETSIQKAYIQLIQESKHYIYIENQFFISNTQDSGPVKNTIAKALVERIIRAARANQKFHVVVVIPEVPGFAGKIPESTSIKTIMAAQWRTINRGGHSIYEEVQKAGFNPMLYIRFYHLRSYDRINAPQKSYLPTIAQQSGVTFSQAQAALARAWVGDSYGQPHVQKTLSIRVPELSKSRPLSEDTETKEEVLPLPKTLQEAKETVWAFQRGATIIKGYDSVADSVSQHALWDKTRLEDEKWLGTEEEERASYVSELLYIHSKVMIVDDHRVIMGSANFNDRSQKGNGDSEIALVVEDTEEIESRMDGRRYLATRFAATLRRKLYREHLGLIPPQNVTDASDLITTFMKPAPFPNMDETRLKEDALVADPLSNDVMTLWQGTAKTNRDIFTDVFRTVPADNVRSFEQFKEYVPKVENGRMVPEITVSEAKRRLSQIRGHLVEMPLQFLIEEKRLVAHDNPDWLGLNPTLEIYI